MRHRPLRPRVTALALALGSVLSLMPVTTQATSRTAEFQQWQAQQSAQYQAWLSAQDQAFAEGLRKDWEAFQLQKPQVRDAAPKPVAPPVARPQPSPQAPPPPPTIAPATPPVAAPVPPPVVAPPIAPRPAPIAPPMRPAGSKTFTLTTLGAPVAVGVMPGLAVRFDAVPSASTLAGHFEKLAGTPGTPELIDTLTQLSRGHRLNAWSQVLLVNELAAQVHPADARSRRLLVWFLTLKSGMDARLGFSGNDVYLLLPFTSMVYGYTYFTLDDKRYYVLDPGETIASPPASLSTYRQSYDAPRIVDLHVLEPMNVRSPAPRTRELSFVERGMTYRYTITPDPALVDVYDSVPITDLDVYFASTWSGTLREQLHAQLAPQLKDMPEREAINFLLHFVQKTLEYKTDKDQFRRENYLFPDQTLFYPYSDCEDRAILFAALVRDLLGTPVIGLSYPGHVATAVLIPSTGKEDTVDWQGRRYVVADPTFINADVGMAMPGMTADAARAIDFTPINPSSDRRKP